MYNIAFVLEQVLGHVTHSKNLLANVPKDTEVQPFWALIPWETTGLADKLPLYRSNWAIRAGWRTRRMVGELARQARLDAIFYHTQTMAVLSPDWLRRVPGVISLDATPIQYNTLGQFYGHIEGPQWQEKIKYKIHRDRLAAARRIVVWARWVTGSLVSDYGIPADKVVVIPPGVNVQEWICPEPRVGREGPVKILFVGGDMERKGGLLLLDAFRTIRDTSPAREGAAGVELHMVTRAKLQPEPNLFVYNNMEPNSAKLKQLYHDSDIFCLPTFGDCLPMVLSEAGAAGLPSVTTSVAGIPELVRDEESGLLVPPGDTAALTAALARLVAGPETRLKMGSRAVEIVSSEYDAERNTYRLLDLLKDLAHG